MNLLIYDFLGAIQTAFTTATNASTILAGGLWYGRAPQDVESPYGIITITDGKKTYTTNGNFLQNISMKITVYSNGGVASTQVRNIAALLSTAFDFKNKTMLMANGKIVSIQPISNLVELDPQLRESEDVIVSSFDWIIILSGANAL